MPGSEAADGDGEAKADMARAAAELAACLQWAAVALLVVAAFGLSRVKPPGEEELCRVETLGLQNATSTAQDAVLVGCHGLYKTVFVFTRAFACVFLLITVLPLVSLQLARSARHAREAACRYTAAATVDIVGVLLLWVPAGSFLALSAGVTVAMAPITAQWLAIYAVYFGMKAAHQQPPKFVEVVYRGYVACWYTDTFLWVGAASISGLWGFCIADAIRNILAALGCFRPRFDDLDGASEICHLKRLCCRKSQAAAGTSWQRLRAACAAAWEKAKSRARWPCSGCGEARCGWWPWGRGGAEQPDPGYDRLG
mmetsp:Transcript_71276/g.230849  ORF Transcript_71276/g.230849 Transcript_71276/m.230849 type:complete len:312 (+) Transcript_71276:54-989(+)